MGVLGKAVKLLGLNRRQVAVDPYNVLFLEEAEIDGKLVTNVHFGNGRWVTTAHSLDEALATLQTKDEQDSETRIKEWKDRAKATREATAEVDAVMRAIDVKGKIQRYHTEVGADGSRRIEIFLEPIPELTPGTKQGGTVSK